MPGPDHPPGRWPKKITFDNDEFSWVDCGADVAPNTLISDWDDTLGEYVDTPAGTYRLKNSSLEITIVTDGIIDRVDPV